MNASYVKYTDLIFEVCNCSLQSIKSNTRSNYATEFYVKFSLKSVFTLSKT